MQTSHQQPRCFICDSTKNHYDFSIPPFRVEECVNCGMKRLNPQPRTHDLTVAPKTTHPATTPSLETIRTYLSQYLCHPPQGLLLHIQQTRTTLKASITSLATSSPEIQHLPIPTTDNATHPISALLTTLLSEQKQFDYIVLTHVLERMEHPRNCLQQLHQLLTDNGVLASFSPNTDSLPARWRKTKWTYFNPSYRWYFSSQTLRRLLYTESFGEVKVCHLPQKLRRANRLPAGNVMMCATKQPHRPTTKTLSIVIAAFNEEKTIQQVVERALSKKIEHIAIELIIVESRSTDRTREILSQYANHPQVTLILQDKPRGKGNAIREGLAHVTGDFVLIQDADDEYDFEDYDALIEPLYQGEAAFVLGARHGGSAWKMRQFDDQRLAGHVMNLGHWIFTFLVNTLFRVRLKDPFTMFKVFRRDCLAHLTFECDRFDFDFELLVKLIRNGYTPIEIPVNYRSRSFTEGKKVRVILDPLTWIRALIKLRLQGI